MTRVMLISGANKGIGYYMCSEWLKQGNIAIVLDICCEEIDKLKALYGNRLMTFNCNVSHEFEVQECIEKAVDIYERIDLAIHNACQCIFKNVGEYEIHEFNSVLKANFIGAVNLTKSMLPYMVKQKNGRICFTSSGVGVTGYKNISGYAASKGAIESFARCMVLENLDTGVTFHILHPPLTDTESASPLPVPKEFKADPEKVGKGLIRNIYKKRFVITPRTLDRISIWMSYRFPMFMGKLLVKMTDKTQR